MTKKVNIFGHLNSDAASGLVVFLVALPLCLGIALASGAPPLSGIIAGIVGGIVVGFLSKSHLSVSGPAAGLTAIVLTAITDLGAFNIFLTAGLIAGILQLILGLLKAGGISNYFPTNVIEGMLAGIGIIIILKQLPHAVGFDSDFEGSESFSQSDGGNSFSSISSMLDYINIGAVIICAISLAILILWDKSSKLKKVKLLPGALVAVIVSILLNEVFLKYFPAISISNSQLVSLPVPESLSELKNIVIFPDFSGLGNINVWIVGATIAIVASIETLLCIEAADRLDVQKRYTSTNVELRAQGIGNIISSMIGGLPMTSVIVRTSANNSAGAKTKMSAVLHGIFLLASVLAIPSVLNMIPLSTLAAVLLLVGYKLAKPATVLHFWEKGKYQFIPFAATVAFVVLTDLLTGVAVGIVISIIFVLRGNMKRAYIFKKDEYVEGDVIHIELAEEVSFLNKAAIKNTLAEIPENTKVVINASNTVYIAHDVLDMLREFKSTRAIDENIKVKLKGFKKAYELENSGGDHVKMQGVYDAMQRKFVNKKVAEFAD